jgi:hypothetical protein
MFESYHLRPTKIHAEEVEIKVTQVVSGWVAGPRTTLDPGAARHVKDLSVTR